MTRAPTALALAGLAILLPASSASALSGSHVVTATMFTDRSGAGGAITSDSFAELSDPPRSLNWSALGHVFRLPGPLPMYTRLKVTYRGRTLIGRKMDVGAGGRGLEGTKRAIDLSAGFARRLHFFSGLDVVRVTALGAPLPKSPSTASLMAVVRTVAQRGRSVTYKARIRRIVGTKVMSLRYGLERRDPGQRTFHRLHVPGLGVWQYWGPDREFWYRQPVEGLHRRASYRAVVDFHWHDRKRKLLAATTRRSGVYTRDRATAQVQPASLAGHSGRVNPSTAERAWTRETSHARIDQRVSSTTSRRPLRASWTTPVRITLRERWCRACAEPIRAAVGHDTRPKTARVPTAP